MQHLAVILFMAGLILAGSDGEWFPWINFAGLGMIGVVVVVARPASGGFPKMMNDETGGAE